MSYLQTPRLHFTGRFQADTSTVNNDVRHYDSAKFQASFQAPMKVVDQNIVQYNGYWNPKGSAAWRMLGCRITGAVLGTQSFTSPAEDAAVGLVLSGSSDRVAGKLVDLDPQQQMVSEIWGLGIRLEDESGVQMVSSNFTVAPFTDLWIRQQKATNYFDQTLAAAYQSVLTDLTWGDLDASPTLAALRDASPDGLLSIRMNVFGYDRTPDAQDYTTGRVVGTIGPASSSEPKRFTVGRHLIAAVDVETNPFAPKNQIANIQAWFDPASKRVTADFGNALPVEGSDGTFEDVGVLSLGVLNDPSIAQGTKIAESAVTVLGRIDYRTTGWYEQTAGLVTFDASAAPGIETLPLAVLGTAATSGTSDGDAHYVVLNRETLDGLYLRADNYVFRMNPGDQAEITFHASRYGQPLAATATTAATVGFMGGAGTGAKIPGITIPDIATPAGVVRYDKTFATGDDGRGCLTLTASDEGPGCPREYLDGQLYGMAYTLDDVPTGYYSNPLDFVSILAWDCYDIPKPLTWFGAIRPLMLQYANLYPIMSRGLFDLADYQCVVENRDILRLSFALPVSNPNSMPVTRDLSAKKREAILRWLDSRSPRTGLPPRGTPPAEDTVVAQATTPADVAENASNDPNVSSKLTFVRQAIAHQKR